MAVAEAPWGLMSWVASVDHKRIGIMYILLAVFFLVIGGFEALLLRVQLAVPENTFLSSADVQSAVHHARHDHGVSRRDAGVHGLLQLLRALDDRRQRCGLSTAERDELLDAAVRRSAAVLQFYDRLGAGCRMVFLRSVVNQAVQPAAGHRLLDSRAGGHGCRIDRRSDQHCRDCVVLSRARHEPAAGPAVRVDHVHAGDPHRGHDSPLELGDRAVADRPLARCRVLRAGARRFGPSVAAFLLDIRTSRGVCFPRFRRLP